MIGSNARSLGDRRSRLMMAAQMAIVVALLILVVMMIPASSLLFQLFPMSAHFDSSRLSSIERGEHVTAPVMWSLIIATALELLESPTSVALRARG